MAPRYPAGISPNGTRAVIFDFFGTLVAHYPMERFTRNLHEMADTAGVERDAFVRHWCRTTTRDRWSGVHETIADNVRAICDLEGIDLGEDAAQRCGRLRTEFTASILNPRPDAESTLAALADAEVGIGLISDCSAELPELWPATPFARYIPSPVFSCRVGMKKPAPKIYHEACRRLDVGPEECIYVGDGFSDELSGATAVGMRAFLISVDGEWIPTDYRNEIDTWTGPRIGALAQVLDYL